MAKQLDNSEYARARIAMWRTELETATVGIKLRSLVYQLVPCQRTRFELVRFVSRAETARAHLHALGAAC